MCSLLTMGQKSPGCRITEMWVVSARMKRAIKDGALGRSSPGSEDHNTHLKSTPSIGNPGTAPRVTNCFPTQINKQVLQDHTASHSEEERETTGSFVADEFKAKG